jgi:hypothetical protein
MSGLRIPFNFEKPYLQNAFELFEMSHYTFNYDIKALILFMSMEVLFKSGDRCGAPGISENIASFFENDQRNFERLYCEMRVFWKIRNNIAHEGSSGLDTSKIQKLIKKLRRHVRDSIIEIDKIGQEKDEIVDALKNKFDHIECPKK